MEKEAQISTDLEQNEQVKSTVKLYQLGYDPKEDITLFELAKVVGLNLTLSQINRPIPEGAVSEIDVDVIRHYKVVDVTEEYNNFVAEVSKDK